MQKVWRVSKKGLSLKCQQIDIMKATATRNINISKGQRIVKGQEVDFFRVINTLGLDLVEVVTKRGSFNIQTSLLNRFFTINN